MPKTATDTLARITAIDAPPMSTIWSFTAIDAEGKTIVFHADWRQGRDMCEGLLDQARTEAHEEGIPIPENFPVGALVAALDVELIPDECMGISMPSVRPVSLNVERLRADLDKFAAKRS